MVTKAEGENRVIAAWYEVISYWSERHGDHEGGTPVACRECQILALIEVVEGLWNDIDDA